jgi:hypothetical protein
MICQHLNAAQRYNRKETCFEFVCLTVCVRFFLMLAVGVVHHEGNFTQKVYFLELNCTFKFGASHCKMNISVYTLKL